MALTFTSHFGDYLLGLFVTWESIPTDGSGTSDMIMTMKMNLRAKLHVYGYAGITTAGYTTADVATDWTDNNNVFVDYDDFATTGVTPPTTEFPGD